MVQHRRWLPKTQAYAYDRGHHFAAISAVSRLFLSRARRLRRVLETIRLDDRIQVSQRQADEPHKGTEPQGKKLLAFIAPPGLSFQVRDGRPLFSKRMGLTR